jgi:ribosomal protein S18 acetylase RimI-like enzyme
MNAAMGETVVRRLTVVEARMVQHHLCAILQDAVHNGASVGYLAPLSAVDALAYWDTIIEALATPHRILLVAEVHGEIAGTVQLVLETRPNGNHRAEVSKLLVHTAYRRRGIARMLMERIETEARAADRTLLVLDTQTDEPAEGLYVQLGYARTGVVPTYARFPDGRLGATTFMHKLLT